MELLIVRHAIAVARDTPGIPDDERPLTPAGERKFRKAARGLARLVPRPYALLTSPLPRAHQTAEIAAEAWGGMAITTATALVTGSLRDLGSTLAEYPDKSTLALVGHEPHLSELLAHLLGARAAGRLAFRKGGAALVSLRGRLADGGELLFFLPPRVLRRLAE